MSESQQDQKFVTSLVQSAIPLAREYSRFPLLLATWDI